MAELVRARRSGRPRAVALVDLDDFKRINDTFGHATGDRILCDVADTLREHFREIDLPSRLGGEEFSVLLPETDLAQGAREAAERFVTALGDADFGDSSIEAPSGSRRARALPRPPISIIDKLLESAGPRALSREEARQEPGAGRGPQP